MGYGGKEGCRLQQVIARWGGLPQPGGLPQLRGRGVDQAPGQVSETR